MKRRILSLVITSVMLVVIACAAMAENPPAWRGLPNTTKLEWTAPDTWSFTANGNPCSWVNPSAVLGANYWTASIPNFVNQNPAKYMRIQIWFVGAKPVFTGVNGIYGMPGNESMQPFTLVGEMGDPVFWLTDWVIQPNPNWEQISFGFLQGQTAINKVIIDTWCVPEPGSVIALSAGLLGMFGMIRRRK